MVWGFFKCLEHMRVVIFTSLKYAFARATCRKSSKKDIMSHIFNFFFAFCKIKKKIKRGKTNGGYILALGDGDLDCNLSLRR